MMVDGKLAERIFDCLSDGYDDEENREKRKIFFTIAYHN